MNKKEKAKEYARILREAKKYLARTYEEMFKPTTTPSICGALSIVCLLEFADPDDILVLKNWIRDMLFPCVYLSEWVGRTINSNELQALRHQWLDEMIEYMEGEAR